MPFIFVLNRPFIITNIKFKKNVIKENQIENLTNLSNTGAAWIEKEVFIYNVVYR